MNRYRETINMTIHYKINKEIEDFLKPYIIDDLIGMVKQFYGERRIYSEDLLIDIGTCINDTCPSSYEEVICDGNFDPFLKFKLSNTETYKYWLFFNTHLGNAADRIIVRYEYKLITV